MKMLLVLFFASLAAAVPQRSGGSSGSLNDVPIVRSLLDIEPQGNYQYSYETGNGIAAEETGRLINVGSENEAIEAKGSYSYETPEGMKVLITYVADHEGFKPQGDVLPTPHPIPDYIQRSLEYIRSLPPTDAKGNGR